MGKGKQIFEEPQLRKNTFIDPKTGQEMESTRLARLGGLLVGALPLFWGGLFLIRFVDQGGGRWFFDGAIRLINWLAGWVGRGWGLYVVLGLGVGLGDILFGLLFIKVINGLGARVHDGIARWQHFRRPQPEWLEKQPPGPPRSPGGR